MAKKTAKKFEMKRGDIATAIGNILESLEDVDTFSDSPEAVGNALSEARDALESLVQDVEAEAY